MEGLHWEGVAMRSEPSHPQKVRGPDLPAMQSRQARLWNFALGDCKRPFSGAPMVIDYLFSSCSATMVSLFAS